jgi:hypothetical protein
MKPEDVRSLREYERGFVVKRHVKILMARLLGELKDATDGTLLDAFDQFGEVIKRGLESFLMDVDDVEEDLRAKQGIKT